MVNPLLMRVKNDMFSQNPNSEATLMFERDCLNSRRAYIKKNPKFYTNSGGSVENTAAIFRPYQSNAQMTKDINNKKFLRDRDRIYSKI
jgi:hypothetical protein